jgi:hypothetical protein
MLYLKIWHKMFPFSGSPSDPARRKPAPKNPLGASLIKLKGLRVEKFRWQVARKHFYNFRVHLLDIFENRECDSFQRLSGASFVNQGAKQSTKYKYQLQSVAP